jgi:hypothetical protein
VTDAGLKELQQFAELEELILRETRVTDVGMKEIAGLRTLRSLNLIGTAVTGEGLRHLKGLTVLQDLELPHACGSIVGIRTLADLRLLHKFPGALAEYGKRASRPEEVVYLQFQGAPVTAESVRTLKALPNVKEISIGPGVLTDDGLRAFREANWFFLLDRVQGPPPPNRMSVDPEPRVLPTRDDQVKELDLSESLITDRGLVFVTELRNLCQLDLRGSKVTGQGLGSLKDLASLEVLVLPETLITLAELRPLKKTRHLRIYGARLAWSDSVLKEAREAGLLHLLPEPFPRKLTEFGPTMRSVSPSSRRELDLSESEITDKGLLELRECEELTTIHLAHTGVTDVGLKYLTSFKNLRYVNLSGTKVTDDGVAAFEAVMPACEVNRSIRSKPD